MSSTGPLRQAVLMSAFAKILVALWLAAARSSFMRASSTTCTRALATCGNASVAQGRAGLRVGLRPQVLQNLLEERRSRRLDHGVSAIALNRAAVEDELGVHTDPNHKLIVREKIGGAHRVSFSARSAGSQATRP